MISLSDNGGLHRVSFSAFTAARIASSEDPKEDDLAHFEPLDGKGKFDLSDIFAKDDEDEDDKDYGSVFNLSLIHI